MKSSSLGVIVVIHSFPGSHHSQQNSAAYTTNISGYEFPTGTVGVAIWMVGSTSHDIIVWSTVSSGGGYSRKEQVGGNAYQC
jgi:hypothetical protein